MMMLTNLKVCGITTRETAEFCANLGVGALGAVFYDKSPRAVSPQKARALFEGLPERMARVGVFVDMPLDALLATAREAGLDTVQLHGSESVETVAAVLQAGFHAIKVLKDTGKKLLENASLLPVAAGILVECGRGILPGGNGAAWNWADAAPLASQRPFALAGGLTPDNLEEAARASHASAWDISSGVERAPGMKDHQALTALAACAQRLTASGGPIFWKGIHEQRQT